MRSSWFPRPSRCRPPPGRWPRPSGPPSWCSPVGSPGSGTGCGWTCWGAGTAWRWGPGRPCSLPSGTRGWCGSIARLTRDIARGGPRTTTSGRWPRPGPAWSRRPASWRRTAPPPPPRPWPIGGRPASFGPRGSASGPRPPWWRRPGPRTRTGHPASARWSPGPGARSCWCPGAGTAWPASAGRAVNRPAARSAGARWRSGADGRRARSAGPTGGAILRRDVVRAGAGWHRAGPGVGGPDHRP